VVPKDAERFGSGECSDSFSAPDASYFFGHFLFPIAQGEGNATVGAPGYSSEDYD